jgi:hypothetical protein
MTLVNIAFHSMDAAFPVILGADDHSLFGKFLSEFKVVDYISIVGANQVPIGIQVGLGIYLGWSAKGCPPQLKDPPIPGHFREVIFFGDFLYFSGILP